MAVSFLAVAGCADWFAPPELSVRLSIVAAFESGESYAAALASADQLRIRVLRADSAGAFTITAKDTTVSIDPETGEAQARLTLALVRSPQTFRLILTAVRSADGTVLFSGQRDIQVTSSSAGTTISTDTIPLPYVGPRAARVAIAPKDTSVTGTTPFTYRAVAFDTAGVPLVPQPQFTFFLVNPADTAKVKLGKFTGVATPVSGATGQVRLYVQAPGLTSGSVVADTARLFLGAVPAAIRLNPGYANVGVGDTLRFNAQVVDASGNPLPGTTVTWTSRTTAAATVSTTGLVTGVTAGTAVIVASGSGFSDSALVTVVAPTHAVAYTASSVGTSTGRGFGVARVGDTVVVSVTVDLRYTPDEKLGSYDAILRWNPSALAFIDVQNGTYVAPTVNTDSVAAGRLDFAAADPQQEASPGGSVVVARVRFRAAAAGSSTMALTIEEMSGAPPTFTNLLGLNRVTVTSGHVTVRQ
ncbi:hypothetical protein HRbin33_00445 [bacterium HR33]|nr:hypothetical protein HRbin33_00445 [bacterium HR33]